MSDEPRYREPIERDLRRSFAPRTATSNCRFVLLGSIATKKYVDVLLPILGERLLFPAEFVGRGDMSRGGLMLRAAREHRELDYIPIEGAIRHGTRPPSWRKFRAAGKDISCHHEHSRTVVPIGLRRGWSDWQKNDLRRFCAGSRSSGFDAVDLMNITRDD